VTKEAPTDRENMHERETTKVILPVAFYFATCGHVEPDRQDRWTHELDEHTKSQDVVMTGQGVGQGLAA
jgi:hypothetical protein